MHLRPATPADAEAVLALWQAAGATESVTDTLAEVQRISTREQVAFILAEVDGRIVGSIIAAFDGWRGNMYRLATHPEFRRKGIATALVHKAEHAMAGWGAKRITALVEKSHPDAVQFWQALGYADDARMARFVRTLGPDAVHGRQAEAPSTANE